MARGRDNQRSKVYAWERAIAGSEMGGAVFADLAAAQAWMQPIWRKERGRVGLAKRAAPSIERPHWGQRRALAHADNRITLPKWARSYWVVLHEMAHRLTPHDEAHGPRFVGVLIGLVCRWLDYDAASLMRLADERGVRYSVRSIGAVPIHGPAWHLERALRSEGAMTPMDAACHLSLGCGVDVNLRQIHGAALYLRKKGTVRMLRGKLVLLAGEA